MQVAVEKTSEIKRKITVKISEEVIQEKMEARLKTLAREIKLDGFRPGKVPQHVVKRMYGERIRGEIAGDLMQSSYVEVLQEQDLKPVGPPHIHPSDSDSGFEYTAEFEVFPEVSLTTLDQIEVARSVASVEDADVDAMIKKLRGQKKDWHAVERAAQQSDRITINLSGQSEGENFTDGTVENHPVEIGAQQMIPGFEEHLIGLKPGDAKTFSVTFPDQYGNEKLAGKSAEFEIEVIALEEPVLPEVDAEFIKAYGFADGDLQKFCEDIKNNMQRDLAQAIRNNLKKEMMDALYEKITITLPQTLIDQEIESLMKLYKEKTKKQNKSQDELELSADAFDAQARRRVALGLIMAEIIQQNQLKVDADKVRATLEDMAKSYETPDDIVNWYYADKGRLSEIEQMVLEDQTVTWLEGKVKVTERPATYNELITSGN